MRSDSKSPFGWSPVDADHPDALRQFEWRQIQPQLDMTATAALKSPRLDQADVPAELVRAYAALRAAPHYVMQRERSGANAGFDSHEEIRYQAPDRFHKLERRAGMLQETLRIGEQGWMRTDGSPWQPLPAELIRMLASHPEPPRLAGEVVRVENALSGQLRLSGNAASEFGEYAYSALLSMADGVLLAESHHYTTGVGTLKVQVRHERGEEILPPAEQDPSAAQ